MDKKFAEVAPAIPLSPKSPQSYTYKLPRQKNIKKYSQVTIPFGPRFISGVVVGLHNRPTFPRLKTLKTTALSHLTLQQIQLGRWISRTMHGGLGYTLRLFKAPGPPPKSTTFASRKQRTRRHPDTLQLTPAPPSISFLESDRHHRYRVLADYINRHHSQQVFIMVPETWRTSELESHLAKRISGPVTTFHGQLKASHLNRVWHALHAGRPLVVIGTQKALFLPWRHLSLVVIEEEFNPSHKLWDQYPRLSNLDGARKLAHIHQAQLVSSSSILSLRQFHLEADKNHLLINHAAPQQTQVHALSLEDRRRRRTMPSSFIDTLRRWQANQLQVLIYYNRLSRQSLLSCPQCHTIKRCPDCSSALIVAAAKKLGQIACQRCSPTKPTPAACSSCQKSLKPVPIGLNKIDTLIEQLVTSNILHLDAETARRLDPGQLQKKLSKFDIVIGTSAVFATAPPHQFDRSIWLYPEQELLYPDYRSLEMGRYTLSRLANLAVNRRHPIHLVTRQSHFIKRELTSPLKTFYRRLLIERRALQYPPVTAAVRLSIIHRQDKTAGRRADRIQQSIQDQISDRRTAKTIQARGPFKSLKKTVQAEYHILLTGPQDELPEYYQHLDIDRAELSPHTII